MPPPAHLFFILSAQISAITCTPHAFCVIVWRTITLQYSRCAVRRWDSTARGENRFEIRETETGNRGSGFRGEEGQPSSGCSRCRSHSRSRQL
jgi:hypothetical protein